MNPRIPIPVVVRLITVALACAVIAAGAGCNAVGRVVTARVEIRAGTNKVVITQPKDTLVGELQYDAERGSLTLRDYRSSSKVEAIEAARAQAEAQARTAQSIANAFDSGFRAAGGAFGVRIPDRGDSAGWSALGSSSATPPSGTVASPKALPPPAITAESGSKLVPIEVPGLGTVYRIAPKDDPSLPRFYNAGPFLVLTNVPLVLTNSQGANLEVMRWFDGTVIGSTMVTNDPIAETGGGG